MPPPRRDAPSSQWRSVILEKQQETDSANNNNNSHIGGGKSPSSRKVLHANWIHATRSILLTVAQDSSVWIVDLDYFQSQQQRQQQQKGSTNNIKKTNGGQISFQINSRLGAVAATSIRSIDENYSLVGNEIVNEIYGCNRRNNNNNNNNNNNFVDYDSSCYYSLGAVATKSGLVMTFSCSAASPTLQTWNLKSTNNNVEDDATKSIHQIQLAPNVNNYSINQSCQVVLLVWSCVGNSIFVCCNSSSSGSTFAHRISGSDWIFGSKISSFLFVSGGFLNDNNNNKQSSNQVVVGSFWVSRGREIQKISIHANQKYSSPSLRGIEPQGEESSSCSICTSSSSSFTLPFLFFAEDVAGIREIGPFNLEKKSYNGNSPNSSWTTNEKALLVTRAGTARILMRRGIAQMMGITTSSNTNTSTSNTSTVENITNSENLTDDEKYVKEWIEMMKETKQQSFANMNPSHQNNRYQQTNDGFFAQEEVESSNKNNYGDSFRSSTNNSQNVNNNNIKGKIKLESVCTCEVPGGDGYIRSIDVSPSGSVVALAFESGVIVVGFVAMKTSPAAATLASTSVEVTNSNSNNNNNNFYIPVVPQLLFVARTVSRIPRKASSLLVVDERRASLLSLDAAGVLELLIFPSALRRQQSIPLSGEEDTSLRKIAAAMMQKNNKSQSSSLSPLFSFSSTNHELLKSNSSNNNNINRLQSPQNQVVGTSKLFSSGPKSGDLRKEMQTTFSSCVERVAAVQRAGPLDDASVKGLPPIRTATCVGGNNNNLTISESCNKTAAASCALASSICGELEKIKTAMFSQVLLHVSRLLSSGQIENNNPETFLTTVILLYLKVNRLLLQGTEMCLPSCATNIVSTNNNNRTNKNLKRKSMNQKMQVAESEVDDDNENDEIIAKRIVNSLLRQDEPHFASGMNDDLSLFSSRRTSAAISLDAFLVSGIFLPNFSPYTSVTTRDEFFLVHTVMMLLTHGHMNQGATNNNSTIMSAARLFSTVHTRGSKLLNLVETARAQAFAASAPSFGPSTAATKIKLWKTLMAQKMKKMFQQKKPTNHTSNNNENIIKKNNKNNVANRGVSTNMISLNGNNHNGNNTSSRRQLSPVIMISSLAQKILREFDLQWIQSLREKMILLRYLVDDDATATYCSSLINAP